MRASESSHGPYHASEVQSNAITSHPNNRTRWAWIALGSNLGDRRTHLERALTWLAALPHTRLSAASPFMVTAPVGPPQPDYLNAVARLETSLAPLELMDALLVLERAAGRERGCGEIRWGPRTLDLDLLFVAAHRGPTGQRTVSHPRLELPHPRVHLREFVLRPLAAIDPDLIHPTTGHTVRYHLAAVSTPPPNPAGSFI